MRKISLMLITACSLAMFSGYALAAQKTVTIRGELSCGTGMRNIADEYDIPFPIKGIKLFDFCKDGDECEIKAQVDGNTVVKIISAKKIK